MDEVGGRIVGVPLEDEAVQARLAELYAQVPPPTSFPVALHAQYVVCCHAGCGSETCGGITASSTCHKCLRSGVASQ